MTSGSSRLDRSGAEGSGGYHEVYRDGFSAICGAVCKKNLVRAPRALGEYPRLGRVVPEFERGALRELIMGSYRIIYEIRADTCYVEAVIHASRDLMRHYQPGEWDVTDRH